MRKKISFLLFFLLCSASLFAQDKQKWQEKRSTHFITYYRNAPENFIDRVINSSENYYSRIADDLGFTRFSFWLWEERAKIYVYDNQQDFQSATGQPSWSGGFAAVKQKTIATFPFAQGFTETILPHELCHIIFREFVGFDNYALPLWLEEGVAAYQEKNKYSGSNAFLREAIKKNEFLPLTSLMNYGSALGMQDNTAVLYYCEAFSIIDYLMREFGRERFIVFCQALRDKRNLESAVRTAYPYSNLQELGKAWEKHIKNE